MPLDQQGFEIDAPPARAPAITQPANPFTLESLIAWLETKPAGEEYCWTKGGECLFAQYGAHVTGKERSFAYIAATEGFHGMPIEISNERGMGEPLSGLASMHPHTFGAALSRARKLLAERAP